MSELGCVGALVRSIHDASGQFAPVPPFIDEVLLPAASEELMCHNDLSPWNLVIGDRWVFIDWDGSGPSRRLWELADAAQSSTVPMRSCARGSRGDVRARRGNV
ncbi:phosphotransferase [Arthrobacter rhombi]|uniref:phosphotransferase n=1 Tax=Arthrobacter rhombi TaxID=71253 RepID=UPI003FD0CFE6